MRWVAVVILVCQIGPGGAGAEEPPALNPFAPRPSVREDALPGCVELSDGTVKAGQIYLTRDARLEIYDAVLARRRDVPLSAITRLDCDVQREWMEKEWRFRENANDAKVYTGRSYPAREYVHTLTLRDGRKLRGPLNAIVYVQGEIGKPPEKFVLHERDKAAVGAKLSELVYVRSVQLGDEAFYEAQRRAAANRQPGPAPSQGTRTGAESP